MNVNNPRDRYLELTLELLQLRAEKRTDDTVESRYCDLLDQQWWAMPDEERAAVDRELTERIACGATP